MKRYPWIISLVFVILLLSTSGPSRAQSAWDRPAQTITQNDPNNGSRSKVLTEVGTSKTDRAMTDARTEAFKRRAGIAFVILASCTLILFILGCGSRVVVFADSSDVFMSASILLAPVVTVLAAGLLLLALPPDPSQADVPIWQGWKDNLALTFILLAGLLWWAWAIIGTLVSSIRYNGLIIGSVIAVLKIGALLSLFLAWLGVLNNYDEQHNQNHSLAKVVIFGILIWFASKMVNGERVMNRRYISENSNGTLVHTE